MCCVLLGCAKWCCAGLWLVVLYISFDVLFFVTMCAVSYDADFHEVCSAMLSLSVRKPLFGMLRCICVCS